MNKIILFYIVFICPIFSGFSQQKQPHNVQKIGLLSINKVGELFEKQKEDGLFSYEYTISNIVIDTLNTVPKIFKNFGIDTEMVSLDEENLSIISKDIISQTSLVGNFGDEEREKLPQNNVLRVDNSNLSPTTRKILELTKYDLVFLSFQLNFVKSDIDENREVKFDNRQQKAYVNPSSLSATVAINVATNIANGNLFGRRKSSRQNKSILYLVFIEKNKQKITLFQMGTKLKNAFETVKLDKYLKGCLNYLESESR